VKKDLYSISQGTRDIATYFTEIKRLWDEHDCMIAVLTCACGVACATYKYDQKMKEKEQLIQLLVGLNDVYKGVRGNILMSRPLPNVSEAHYMLLQEEHQREMSSETHILPQSATLYNTSSNNHHSLGEQESLGLLDRTDGFRGNGFGNRGGKTNGYNNNGSSNGPNNSYNITDNSNYPYNGGFHKTTTSRRQFFCDHCKMTGHTVQRCYKIHGYPPGHKLHKGKRLAASVSQE